MICLPRTTDNSTYFAQSLEIRGIESRLVNIFLPISFNISFGCSKEPSRDGSFEYPQHKFWLRNKNIFLCPLL